MYITISRDRVYSHSDLGLSHAAVFAQACIHAHDIYIYIDISMHL